MEEKFEIPDDVIACGCNTVNISNIKKLIVFYVDVGQLPPMKAEIFVDRVRDNNRNIEERLKDTCIFMYVPVRPNSETRVEVVEL